MMKQTLTLAELRQAEQLRLIEAGEDLTVGSRDGCPLPIDVLRQTTGDESYVIQAFHGGLTARVFRIRANDQDWTLKVARRPPLVKNVDGQTSFLNEIQRRREIAALKRAGAVSLEATVDTVFGSLADGILVSPWIPGEPVENWDDRTITSVIKSLCALHLNGFFEWDPSPGNLVDDGYSVRLFDFGYMYRFDPLVHLNTAGHGTDMPMYHPVERFETRTLMGHLLRLEQANQRQHALEVFELTKSIGISAYEELTDQLAERGAHSQVTGHFSGLAIRWQNAINSDLEGQYLKDSWRAHVTDVEDDLSGKTCTPMTAYSMRSRTPFRCDGGQHSAVMADTVPR